MARSPDNVAVFHLGHFETMVFAKALAHLSEDSEFFTEERNTAKGYAGIFGHDVRVTLLVESRGRGD